MHQISIPYLTSAEEVSNPSRPAISSKNSFIVAYCIGNGKIKGIIPSSGEISKNKKSIYVKAFGTIYFYNYKIGLEILMQLQYNQSRIGGA